jgi:outer membrane protein TolC
MLQAKLEAVKTKPAQNSNLPDPVLSIGALNIPINSFSFTQEPMTGKMVSLSQAFPFPGKLASVSNVYENDIEATAKEIEEEKNKLRMNVVNAYLNLALVREKIQTTIESKELLKTIKEVVQTKYEVNEASQQNIFKIELELTRLDDELSMIKSEEQIALMTINSYLFRDSQSPITTIDLTVFYKMNNHGTDSLLQSAKLSKPVLAQIELMKIKAAKMEEQSNYEFYPDFNLTLQYSQRDEIAKTNTNLDDFFSVILGIKLPINYGGKKSAKVSEAISMQDLYDQQYKYNLQMLRISFETSTAKINSLLEREKLINNILLLQAEENFNSALSSYQVNKIDFINVNDALNKLLNFETKLYQIRTDYYKEIASLEFLTGRKFFHELD